MTDENSINSENKLKIHKENDAKEEDNLSLWYGMYIFLGLIVLGGMKYMNSHE